jgi:hypothetical protein
LFAFHPFGFSIIVIIRILTADQIRILTFRPSRGTSSVVRHGSLFENFEKT